MKVLSVTRRSSTVRVLEIEVSGEEYAIEENRAYAALRREVKVPGFRPGKVPRDVLRARYGKALEADAVESCVAVVLSEALESAELTPLAEPVVRDVERTPEGGVTFKAEVEVLPELAMPDFEKLRVVRETEEVSGEQVEERLDGLRRMAARVTKVDRPVREGDLIRFSYQRLDPSGVPLVGTTVEDNTLVVGEREDLRPFWEAMLDAKAGETRSFSVGSETAGPRASAPDGATRDQRYSVTINDVSERELPELDDDFAKEVGQFGSLEELREHLRVKLIEDAEHAATGIAQTELLRQVVEKSGVEPSPSLVSRYMDSLVQDAKEAHEARGDQRPFDEDHIREAHKAEVRAQVAEYLVLRRIARDQGLEPNDDEVRSFVAAVSGREPTADELTTMRGRLRELKVRDFLIEKAKVKDVKKKVAARGGRVLTP